MAYMDPPSANGSGTAVHESTNSQPSELDIALPAMDALSEEFSRLAAVNAELVGRLRGAAGAPSARPALVLDDGERSALRDENTALRSRVAELEQLLATPAGDDDWTERQREYEALLDEKSEVIRNLHLKLQEVQEGARRAPDEPLPKEDQLIQLKKELEEQRQQLQQDEDSLMGQMRQMELALSKDRAELARQRQDVQRLQADLNREIEQTSRDPALRERLNNLRRGQEAPAKEEPVAAASTAADTAKPNNSGLFRRLFG
jgi:DNA repair exonuclease SbcCD ATPase subunit